MAAVSCGADTGSRARRSGTAKLVVYQRKSTKSNVILFLITYHYFINVRFV